MELLRTVALQSVLALRRSALTNDVPILHNAKASALEGTLSSVVGLPVMPAIIVPSRLRPSSRAALAFRAISPIDEAARVRTVGDLSDSLP
jgi:hypothetical protein